MRPTPRQSGETRIVRSASLRRLYRFFHFDKRHYIGHFPKAIRDARRHRWRNPQRLMDAAEVVVDEVQGPSGVGSRSSNSPVARYPRWTCRAGWRAGALLILPLWLMTSYARALSSHLTTSNVVLDGNQVAGRAKNPDTSRPGVTFSARRRGTSCHDDIWVTLPHIRSDGVMLICAFRGLGV